MFVCFCRPGSCNQALSLTARFYPLPLDLTDFSKPPEPQNQISAPLKTSSYPPSSYYQFFMSIFTPNIEEAKLYVQIFKPLAQCALSLKSRFIRERLSGCLRELKTKRKVQLGNPKSGRGHLLERSLTRAFNYKV